MSKNRENRRCTNVYSVIWWSQQKCFVDLSVRCPAEEMWLTIAPSNMERRYVQAAGLATNTNTIAWPRRCVCAHTRVRLRVAYACVRAHAFALTWLKAAALEAIRQCYCLGEKGKRKRQQKKTGSFCKYILHSILGTFERNQKWIAAQCTPLASIQLQCLSINIINLVNAICDKQKRMHVSLMFYLGQRMVHTVFWTIGKAQDGRECTDMQKSICA